MDILHNISEELQFGDDEKVEALTAEAIETGIDPKTILNDALIAGMNIVGKKFRDHEIFLPDVLMAAKAMHKGTDLLKPLFIANDIPSKGKIIIGTVKGDLHDLGKNLAGIMLKGAGYEVIDLGKDVPAEKFIETALEEEAHLIGMSALLTTTMPEMKNIIDLIKEKGLNKKIKTIVGGAPLTEEFAKEIGADAYAFDASKSVECVNQLMGAV